MSETTFSPGPWMIAEAPTSETRVRIFSSSDEEIAAAEAWGETPEKRDANARLIAAAPELFEALTRYVVAERMAAPYSASPLRLFAERVLAAAQPINAVRQ